MIEFNDNFLSEFEPVDNESIIEERFQNSIQQNALFGDGRVPIVLGGNFVDLLQETFYFTFKLKVE